MKRCMVLFLVICSFIGCGTSSTHLMEMEKEYESILASDLSLKERVMMMTDFELNNPSHFNSKVALASFYIVRDYEKARDYLKRAKEVMKNAPKTDEEDTVAILYSLLAQGEFNTGSFAEAERYLKKAIETHSEFGEREYYFLGQIQLVQGKVEEALKSYDFAFSTLPEETVVPEDLYSYMSLLADAERFTECIPILERYFETGEYFSGLGTFASTVYEKAGEIEKSILSILLEWEVHSVLSEPDHDQFMRNLDAIEIYAQTRGTDAIGVPALQLIRSIYDKDIIVEDTFSSFFVARYCILIRKIMDNTLTFENFEEYRSLEKYFKKFPVYYWNVWTMAKMLYPSELLNHTIMLEKIIDLQPNEFYMNNAKHELGALFGLDEDASKTILTARELRLIVSEYVKTGKYELFDKIYSLLELPDNSYVTHAMEYLKDNREEYVEEDPIEYAKFNEQKYVLEDILSAKLQTADGRLRERLEYILE